MPSTALRREVMGSLSANDVSNGENGQCHIIIIFAPGRDYLDAETFSL